MGVKELSLTAHTPWFKAGLAADLAVASSWFLTAMLPTAELLTQMVAMVKAATTAVMAAAAAAADTLSFSLILEQQHWEPSMSMAVQTDLASAALSVLVVVVLLVVLVVMAAKLRDPQLLDLPV